MAVHSHYMTDSFYVLLQRLVLCQFSDVANNSNSNNKWLKNFDERPHRISCHY